MVSVVGLTRRLQQRVPLLPARVVAYPVVAGCQFIALGYPQVWQQLTEGLAKRGRRSDLVFAYVGSVARGY